MTRDEMNTTIIEMTRAGHSREEVGAVVGLAPHTVSRWRARLGCSTYRELSEPDRARIVEMASTGLPTTEIAEAVGYSPTTVDRVRRRSGNPATIHRRYIKVNSQHCELIVTMTRQGHSLAEISAVTGLAEYAISNWRRKLGCQVHHELTPEERARVIELTHRGWSSGQIAQELNTTPRTVCRIRHNAGCKAATNPLTEDELSIAAAMLDDGASYAEVGRTIGRPLETVRNRFPGRGWTRAQTHEFNRFRKQFGALAKELALTETRSIAS